ncbi:MAG: hypothetical protein U0798_10530 [Gemmataceae bacterium]
MNLNLEIPEQLGQELRAKASALNLKLEQFALLLLTELTRSTQEKQSVPSKPELSIFDLIGKAPQLRTGQDITEQLAIERETWGNP